jgi:hypothetical protein
MADRQTVQSIAVIQAGRIPALTFSFDPAALAEAQVCL